jgi:hypothetical protein
VRESVRYIEREHKRFARGYEPKRRSYELPKAEKGVFERIGKPREAKQHQKEPSRGLESREKQSINRKESSRGVNRREKQNAKPTTTTPTTHGTNGHGHGHSDGDGDQAKDWW